MAEWYIVRRRHWFRHYSYLINHQPRDNDKVIGAAHSQHEAVEMLNAEKETKPSWKLWAAVVVLLFAMAILI